MKNEPDYQFFHAQEIIARRCTGCMQCVRICPTQAIRVHNNKVKILPELCIDCGECVEVCPENVFVPVIDELVDFGHFKYLIAILSPVLYTQFNLDVNPSIIHKALKNIGFSEVVDLSDTVKEMTIALHHYIKTHEDTRPFFISLCPTIVRLIQVSYPNLVNLITPLDVPREILAKRIKQTYPQKLGLKLEEIAVVYITPCTAKIISIKQPAEKEHSWIDSSIPIKDIYNLILPEIMDIQEKEKVEDLKDFHFSNAWRTCDYLTSDQSVKSCLSVTGLEQVKNVLDDIESSKLRNIDFIGALACEKECLGGAYCVENPYISRHNSILLEQKYGKRNYELDEEKMLANYKKGYYFLENPISPRSTVADSPDIATSIKRMRQKERISMKLPQKDCALCGAPTCKSFAEDCAYGRADIMDCAFFSEKFKK